MEIKEDEEANEKAGVEARHFSKNKSMLMNLTVYRGRHPQRFEILTQTASIVQFRIYDAEYTYTITVCWRGGYSVLREPP